MEIQAKAHSRRLMMNERKKEQGLSNALELTYSIPPSNGLVLLLCYFVTDMKLTLILGDHDTSTIDSSHGCLTENSFFSLSLPSLYEEVTNKKKQKHD